MKVTHSKIAASVAGLALLALVANPGPAAAGHGAVGPTQHSHVGQAQGGGSIPPGKIGHGSGGQGMMGGGHTGPGATQPGMMGQGMKGHDMMPMMQMHRRMMQMHQQMMGQGMMGHHAKPMMHQKRSRMMGLGISGHGMRVVPGLNLSTGDVREFLKMHLGRIGNKRLKVGEVTLTDDGSITADVVTVDDSLVQRFKVNRHNGWMQQTD